MKTNLFNYHLPKNLIAQKPARPRDHARLLVLDRKNNKISHDYFYNLTRYLSADDVLVLNDTKVFPARLPGHKVSGGQVEIFLLKPIKTGVWEALVGGRTKLGDKIILTKGFSATVLRNRNEKIKQIKFNISGAKLNKKILQLGHTPLPPYIKTKDSREIRAAYQTVFARYQGSVAAPTAGLHFTPALLKKLKKQGIKIYKITLHVGWGTFAPVTSQQVEEHKLHPEWASISPGTARALNRLKAQGRKIVAVGTTSARALEARSNANGQLKSGGTWINLYIYPGYKFKFIDKLITNFHLPKTSLLFLVSALASRAKIMRAYSSAVKKKYRFYSFGDAMLIK